MTKTTGTDSTRAICTLYELNIYLIKTQNYETQIFFYAGCDSAGMLSRSGLRQTSNRNTNRRPSRFDADAEMGRHHHHQHLIRR